MGSIEPNSDADEAVQVAAAILVLIEGANAPICELLEPLGEPNKLAVLHRKLCEGSRDSRAKGLAAILARLGLDLDRWRIG